MSSDLEEDTFCSSCFERFAESSGLCERCERWERDMRPVTDAQDQLAAAGLVLVGKSELSEATYWQAGEQELAPRLRLALHSTTGRGGRFAVDVGNHQDADFGLSQVVEAVRHLRALHAEWIDEGEE